MDKFEKILDIIGMQNIVVKMKDELEQIKEQVLNAL